MTGLGGLGQSSVTGFGVEFRCSAIGGCAGVNMKNPSGPTYGPVRFGFAGNGRWVAYHIGHLGLISPGRTA